MISANEGWISAWRRSRRLDGLVGRYVITLVVVLTVVVASISTMQYLDARMRRIDAIRLDAQRLLQLQIDQETGVRGYDATDSQLFLQPYALSQQPTQDLIQSLLARLDDPTAIAALNHLAETRAQWIAQIAKPIIHYPDNPKNEQLQAQGKKLIDSERADIAGVEAVYESAWNRLNALKASIRYISAVVTIVSILLIASTGYLAERRSALREEQLLRTLIKERDDESRRSEWRTKIIAMLAHDFRSSLGVVRAYADLLESFPEKRNDDAPYDGIRKAVSDLSAMSDEALLMARTSNNALYVHVRPVAIGDILQEAALRYRDDRDISIPPISEYVMGDRAYLVRVFDNLIGNAVKYSPEGSAVWIEIHRPDPQSIEIAVCDRGRGIDPADLPHVFNEFWRAPSASAHGGSGIGLYIVKKIVDAHGGAARIDSRIGEGTAVRIVLPAAVNSPTVNAG